MAQRRPAAGTTGNPFDDEEEAEGQTMPPASTNPFDDDDAAGFEEEKKRTSSTGPGRGAAAPPSTLRGPSPAATRSSAGGGGSSNPFDEDDDDVGGSSAARHTPVPPASALTPKVSSTAVRTPTTTPSSPLTSSGSSSVPAPASASSPSAAANQLKSTSSGSSSKTGSGGFFSRLSSSMSSSGNAAPKQLQPPSQPQQPGPVLGKASVGAAASTQHSAPVPIASSSSGSNASSPPLARDTKGSNTGGRAYLTLSSSSFSTLSSTPPIASSPLAAELDFFSSSPLATSLTSSSVLATAEETEEQESVQMLDMNMINMSTEPINEQTAADEKDMGEYEAYRLPATSYVRTAAPTIRQLQEKAEEQVQAIAEYREYNLQSFRTLAEKRALLDAAAVLMDGNTLMTIILYLQDTLNSSNFLSLIGTHKEASDMYLRHLRLQGRHVDRVLVYHARRDHKREGLARLALCYRVTDPEKRLAAFRDCLQFFQVLHPKLFEFESKQLADQIKLLEIQMQMEFFLVYVKRVDAARAAKGEPLFVSFPRTTTLSSGLGATLYYSLFYHSYETKGKAREIAFLPENIRKTFNINEKRFFWLKLRVLCCQKQWVAVKQLPSSSLFSSRPTSPIGFEPFVDMIHLFNGPTQLQREFVMLIKSPKKRYRAAFRTGQYDLAIDALTVDKNEEELRWLIKELKMRLGPVLSVEYRTKIERSIATIRAAARS